MIIYLFPLLILAYPLLVLVHELGHALVVIGYGRPATAMAGDGSRSVRIKIGRLALCFSPLARGGSCVFDSSGLTIHQRRMVLLGGPLASGVAALLLAVCAYLLVDPFTPAFWIIAIAATAAAADACRTAWPHRHRSRHFGDGTQLRRLSTFERHYVPPRQAGERVICRLGG